MENITQYGIWEDLSTLMYIIKIFKISFLDMWLFFWHGSVTLSLLACPDEFLCWLSLRSLFWTSPRTSRAGGKTDGRNKERCFKIA